ncbi:GNAT family N-acetyltransferase [Ulvibacterium sp.]|uniref:GNAT family N-acetyltransferase n=1 Tax=Ulvibacterium sp. TaxID=2665914 RepID=UPI003BAD7116
MIELKKYTKEDHEIWDNFIESSKNGIFLFYRDYMDYHADRFVDHSVIVAEKNKVIALFPANEKEDKIISHSGLTFGSLIMSYGIKTAKVLEVFQLIMEYYTKLGFSKIILKIPAHIFHRYPSEEDLYALNRLNASLIRRDISSVIRINNRIRFLRSKRRAVQKCFRDKIDFLENNDFTEYWDLLTEVVSKFNVKPVHSLQEIVYLNKLFPEKIRLFEARKEGRLLAGAVIYDYDNVIHVQYQANSQEGRKMGALEFLHHNLINKIFMEREYYSFGISSENEGKKLNRGLIQQKERMGARGIALDFYSLPLETSN